MDATGVFKWRHDKACLWKRYDNQSTRKFIEEFQKRVQHFLHSSRSSLTWQSVKRRIFLFYDRVRENNTFRGSVYERIYRIQYGI